ncbi:dTMP kinase [Methylocella sp.]|uniref:dTMP kinase n=1 Tax=Methylocella sp. TaxID=1978226 RepID=UPI0035B29633
MSPRSEPGAGTPARGRFITFEGGEGAGKSTQIGRLAGRLREVGLDVLATREPGGSPQAEALRRLLLSGAIRPLGPAAEALLFAAARIDHIDVMIEPALAAGAWVACDRFADSTRAYQGSGAIDPRLLDALERVALGGLRPDLTIILDVSPQIGLRRASLRRGAGETDRFERESVAFHETIRGAFLQIARDDPGRCAVIDADASQDEVAARVWRVVRDRLSPRSEPDRHGRKALV